MKFEIYTDGACSGNPGPGGYAFIILNERKFEKLAVHGYEKNATNNMMELKAIVRALEHAYTFINRQIITQVTVYSDSAYCINAINEKWYENWENNGWRTKSNDPVKNQELWEKLSLLLKPRKNLKFKFVKVKGHAGNVYNEKVDKAAKRAIKLLIEREAEGK